jgi:hypothetical protein
MALEEDILQDRKDTQCVSYLSSWNDCGVHVAGLCSWQNPRNTEDRERTTRRSDIFFPALKGHELSSYFDLTETLASRCSKSDKQMMEAPC